MLAPTEARYDAWIERLQAQLASSDINPRLERLRRIAADQQWSALHEVLGEMSRYERNVFVPFVLASSLEDGRPCTPLVELLQDKDELDHGFTLGYAARRWFTHTLVQHLGPSGTVAALPYSIASASDLVAQIEHELAAGGLDVAKQLCDGIHVHFREHRARARLLVAKQLSGDERDQWFSAAADEARGEGLIEIGAEEARALGATLEALALDERSLADHRAVKDAVEMLRALCRTRARKGARDHGLIVAVIGAAVRAEQDRDRAWYDVAQSLAERLFEFEEDATIALAGAARALDEATADVGEQRAVELLRSGRGTAHTRKALRSWTSARARERLLELLDNPTVAMHAAERGWISGDPRSLLGDESLRTEFLLHQGELAEVVERLATQGDPVRYALIRWAGHHGKPAQIAELLKHERVQQDAFMTHELVSLPAADTLPAALVHEVLDYALTHYEMADACRVASDVAARAVRAGDWIAAWRVLHALGSSDADPLFRYGWGPDRIARLRANALLAKNKQRETFELLSTRVTRATYSWLERYVAAAPDPLGYVRSLVEGASSQLRGPEVVALLEQLPEPERGPACFSLIERGLLSPPPAEQEALLSFLGTRPIAAWPNVKVSLKHAAELVALRELDLDALINGQGNVPARVEELCRRGAYDAAVSGVPACPEHVIDRFVASVPASALDKLESVLADMPKRGDGRFKIYRVIGAIQIQRREWAKAITTASKLNDPFDHGTKFASKLATALLQHHVKPGKFLLDLYKKIAKSPKVLGSLCARHHPRILDACDDATRQSLTAFVAEYRVAPTGSRQDQSYAALVAMAHTASAWDTSPAAVASFERAIELWKPDTDGYVDHSTLAIAAGSLPARLSPDQNQRLLATVVNHYNGEATARWFVDCGQSAVLADFLASPTQEQRSRVRDGLVAAGEAGDAELFERLLAVRPTDKALSQLKATVAWCIAIRHDHAAQASGFERLMND